MERLGMGFFSSNLIERVKRATVEMVNRQRKSLLWKLLAVRNANYQSILIN